MQKKLLLRISRHLAHILFALLFVIPFWVTACDDPVFKYALKNWEPDPYPVYVFHRSLSADEKKALATLKQVAANRGATANVELNIIDLSEDPQNDSYKKYKKEARSLPWVLARFPLHVKTSDFVWSSSLNSASVDLMLDSPKRTEIVKQLSRGDTAVWLLVMSGNDKKDAAAASVLQDELPLVARTLGMKGHVVKLNAKDSSERFLIKFLNSAIGNATSEPLVYPILGKGRALPPLVGQEITRSEVREAAAYIAGPCTCEIKAQNPGLDMLITADWKTIVGDLVYEVAPAPVSMSDFIVRSQDSK